MKIQTDVDQQFIDKAEREASQILTAQHDRYKEHWNSKYRPILRTIGLVACFIGIIVSIFGIVYVEFMENAPACLDASVMALVLYAVLLLILAAVFYHLPKYKNYAPNWAIKMGKEGAKRTANFCVKEAKKSVPFTAEYDMEDGSITYYRLHHDEKKLVWSRKLQGVAVHGSSVTLFFKKWTSMSPIMVILHHDFGQLEAALDEQKIEFKSLAEQSTDESWR